jgi:hypothetical protein
VKHLRRIFAPTAGMLATVAAWNLGDAAARRHRHRVQVARAKYPPPVGFRSHTAAGLPRRPLDGHPAAREGVAAIEAFLAAHARQHDGRTP